MIYLTSSSNPSLVGSAIVYLQCIVASEKIVQRSISIVRVYPTILYLQYTCTLRHTIQFIYIYKNFDGVALYTW